MNKVYFITNCNLNGSIHETEHADRIEPLNLKRKMMGKEKRIMNRSTLFFLSLLTATRSPLAFIYSNIGVTQ